MSTPLMGRGEVSEKKLLPKLEIHAGTTGLINNQTWTKLGVGLGISQRIRFWFGEGTREVGVHLFHLSRKMGRFSVRSRLTTFVGILPHPTRSTVFLLSEQLNVAALWHPSKKKSSFFISFGAFTDITTTSRVGDVIDYGGSVGIGYGLRSEKR